MDYEIKNWSGPIAPFDPAEQPDRLAILQLPKVYALGMDMRDYDLSRSVFSDDAMSQGSLGGAAIDEYLPKVYAGASSYQATQHNITNQHLEMNGDEARLISYAIAVHKAAPGSDMTNLTMGVQYRDWCRKTDKGWLIYRRQAVPQWTETSPAPPAA
ncbi:MAG: nuclear transport factor 2 family protein [Novosphingobium sp.]|nr:nuclear transport factor 2 family protein [Novosphingobium sp.]